MSGNEKNHWPEIKHSRGEILLAQIADPTEFFDLTGDRRPVIGWYFEFFDSSSFYPNRKVSGKVNDQRRKTLTDFKPVNVLWSFLSMLLWRACLL
jgi:hypothetical protein